MNRGVSGDRLPDVYARIVKDMIALRPDYLSLLVGVNDIWHGLDAGNGTGAKRFGKLYGMLLDELKEELPDLRVMILEPFVLEGTATANRDDMPDRFSRFQSGVRELADIARSTAAAYGAVFVPLQQPFHDALQDAPADYWLSDGVHPTAKGHALIMREWLRAFETLQSGV